jgi:hypothetical protein
MNISRGSMGMWVEDDINLEKLIAILFTSNVMFYPELF